MLNAKQILEKINAGESSGTEFKEVRTSNDQITAPRRDSLADELAAFANSSGGTIIFGVTDRERQIVGIDPSILSHLIGYISEICRDSVDPSIVDFYVDSVQVTVEEGEEKHLVYVEVERSLWLHKSKNGYFYRHGDSKREMSTEHLLRIIQSRSQAHIIRFDEQAVPNTNQDTLQRDLYMRFVGDDEPSSLCKRRLLVEYNGTFNATVAGLLMCSPTPDEHIYNSYIQGVFYRGKPWTPIIKMMRRTAAAPWINK